MPESIWDQHMDPTPPGPAPMPVAQTRLIREQLDALRPIDPRPLLGQILQAQREQNARLARMHFWVFWSGLACFIALLPLMFLIVLLVIALVTGGVASVIDAFK